MLEPDTPLSPGGSVKPIILCVLILAVAATNAPAQELPLRPGDRVRITGSAAGRYEVREVTGSTLTVIDSNGRAVDVPFGSIDRLDVSRGPRSSLDGALRGAGAGLLAGAATGVLLGFGLGDDSRAAGVELAMGLGLVGAGAGAALFGFLGAISPGERWERVPLEGVGPRVGITRDGSVAIRYVARF